METNVDDVVIMEKQPDVETSKTQVEEQVQASTPKEVQSAGALNHPLVSQNRFDVLDRQVDSHEQSHKQLEDGDHQENEDNSQGTEFVENTQMTITSKSGTNEVISKQDIAAVKNQENIEFLKQSWANMAEQEDDPEVVPVLEEINPKQAPFTIVVPKNKKKKSPQKPYDTRSKVGHSKPFK
ncbi:hypothetical protein P8452_17963 [Trifolium repens]|nr:hypothetical protein P8452_17963 [Trifolium repens]